MCGSSRLFLIPGSQHLLSTNVFCAHVWPFGYLHFSPPVRMAWCLLLLGHGGNQPLWPCKGFSTAEHLPLLPAPWGTHLLALGSQQPSDFQRMPALDSWLGFLTGHGGRSKLASSRRMAQQPLWPWGPCKPRHTELRLVCSRVWDTADTQPVNPALPSRAESWIKSQPLFSFLRSACARYGTSQGWFHQDGFFQNSCILWMLPDFYLEGMKLQFRGKIPKVSDAVKTSNFTV